MRKITLLISIIFSAFFGNTQNITSVTPPIAEINQTLLVTISGQSTHFAQGTNTISFSQGTNTILFSQGTNTIVSDSTIEATFAFNYPSLSHGDQLDLNVNNSIDGLLLYPNAITVTQCNVTSNFTSVDNGNGDYSFTNTSTGSVGSYYWSFGDGTSSTLSNPNHTFVSNGTFVIQLIITDSSGLCSDIKNITTQVSGVQNPIACNAAFVIYPDSVNTGDVIVYNTSTGSNLSYFWNFGDGTTSTQQFPSHTFAGAGPFNLCLTVTDSLNGGTCSSNYCDSIDSGGLVFRGGGFSISVVPPTATNIDHATNLVTDLIIYPNPFKSSLNIELNILEKTPLNIFVTDIIGNRISEINTEKVTVGENKFIWNATEYSNGIYLLNIKTNNSLKVEKLILNR